MPQIIKHHLALTELTSAFRANKQTIGFVPTMGALHAGHMALVQQAKAQCDQVVASIFVNPTQFGPNEDFDRYPRPIEADIEALKAAQADILYLPEVKTIYPAEFSTHISVAGVSEGLCGGARPGHFDGVCTVVYRLFSHVKPDKAFFGEKDYQQLQVISRMTQDLGLPVEIVPVAIVRQTDGLALSSRNQYLNQAQRQIAPHLYQTLMRVAEKIKHGTSTDDAMIFGKNTLQEAGFDRIDYLEMRDAKTLAPMTKFDKPARLLAAAYLGNTRLIDNIAVE